MARLALRAAASAVAAVCAVAVSIYLAAVAGAVTGLSLAAIALLAAVRPADALLVLAALGPIAAALHNLLQTPYDGQRLFEAAVLSFCGGAALHAAIRPPVRRPTAFEWAAAGFATVVLASGLAQLPTALLRLGIDSAGGALQLLRRDFFANRPPELAAFWQTVVALEGVALGVAAARLSREPGTADRLARMIVAGGAAAAALNVHRLVEVALRNPPFGEGLLRALHTLRFNTQFGDLNAAGSYFAMVAVLAVALAASDAPVRRWRLAAYAVAIALLACALWISGSRVALMAAALGAAGWLLVRRHPRLVPAVRVRTLAAAAAVLAVLTLGGIFLLPATRHSNFSYSVFTRAELVKAGLRMWADRPVTGIGTAQFYAQFPRYASPELLTAFRVETGAPVMHENAHNQFVQVAAELGTVGLAFFAAALVLALWKVTIPDGGARAAAAAAMAAFLVTALAGHPLLIPMVAYVFWLVVGVVASGAAPATSTRGRILSAAVLVIGLLLLSTVPQRWQGERHAADLDGVSLGLSPWQRDPDGNRFRWARERSAVFVSSRAALIRVPLRSPDARARQVEILLDGRPAAALAVPAGLWVDAKLPLRRSPRDPAFRRIDFVVTADAEASAGSERVLMVGRPEEIASEPSDTP